MPWNNNNLIARLVEIAGEDDGLFIYKGAPQAGDLYGSAQSENTTDQYGNTVHDGFVIYSGNARAQLHIDQTYGLPASDYYTGAASESQPSSLYATYVNSGLPDEIIELILSGPASSHDGQSAGVIIASSADDGSSQPSGAFYVNNAGVAGWNSQGLFALRIGTFQPGTPNTRETWHPASYMNGWAASAAGLDLRYTYLATGMVHMSGQLAVPSGYSNGSQVCQLPSNYYPARDEDFPITGYGTSAVAGLLRIGTGGSVQCYSPVSAGQTIRINGQYPLNTNN